MEEGWASTLADEASHNLNLFGEGSDELSLRMGDKEGCWALEIGGITNWDTDFKLKEILNYKNETFSRILLNFSPLVALLLSLRLVDSLQLSLHNPAERNMTNSLSAELRVVKAQWKKLSANWTSADVLPLTMLRMLYNLLHFQTSGSSAACSLSTRKSMNEWRETTVNCLFSRAHISHALFLLICTLHHVWDHHW